MGSILIVIFLKKEAPLVHMCGTEGANRDVSSLSSAADS